jgi:nitrogen fixation/metabolism regulation signal transduction histidine kinase
MTLLRTIRFRIVAAFLVAALAMLAAMGFLVTQYRSVSQQHQLMTQGYLPIAQDVDALALAQERVDNDIERLLRHTRRPGTGLASSAVIYTDRLRQTLGQARIHAASAQAMTQDPRAQASLHKVLAQLEQIDTLFAQYEASSSAIVVLLERERRTEADAQLDPLRSQAAQLGDEIDKLSRELAQRIDTLSQDAEAQRIRASAVAGALAALALGVCGGGLAAVLMALRPIAELTAQVQRLAEGDYSGRAEVRGGDELAVLAGEFNKMVESLRNRDRTLVERAQQLDVLTRYLSSVLNSLEDGLFVVEDSRITLSNPAASQLWGATEDAEPPFAIGALLNRPGRHEIDGPNRTRHEVRISRFGDAGVIVVSVDITEQERARERLGRSERLALVGQMLAQITHEVRNPLNALSLNAELLSDELGDLDPDRKTEAWDLLGTVSGEIERLTEVTAHYLVMARRPKAQLAAVDLQGLLADVRRLLQAELDQGGVILAVAPVDPSPRLADGNQLRQALLNVLRNAAEAGAHKLALSVVSEHGQVRIALTDDGPGMTPDEIKRATDPFFSTKASGTGLGLAITRQILEDHGGSVEIMSEPGRGSTLTLVLPDRLAPPTESPSAEAT